MAKSEWGTKHTCAHCGAKFYDFQKDISSCPKCETVLESVSIGKKRASANEQDNEPPEPAETKETAANDDQGETAAEGNDEDVEADIDDEDDALMMVNDDDDDDDDDLTEVKEHMVVGNEE